VNLNSAIEIAQEQLSAGVGEEEDDEGEEEESKKEMRRTKRGS
jgi:hypothetical protein